MPRCRTDLLGHLLGSILFQILVNKKFHELLLLCAKCPSLQDSKIGRRGGGGGGGNINVNIFVHTQPILNVVVSLNLQYNYLSEYV